LSSVTRPAITAPLGSAIVALSNVCPSVKTIAVPDPPWPCRSLRAERDAEIGRLVLPAGRLHAIGPAGSPVNSKLPWESLTAFRGRRPMATVSMTKPLAVAVRTCVVAAPAGVVVDAGRRHGGRRRDQRDVGAPDRIASVGADHPSADDRRAGRLGRRPAARIADGPAGHGQLRRRWRRRLRRHRDEEKTGYRQQRHGASGR
jgi:hypothetical protein